MSNPGQLNPDSEAAFREAENKYYDEIGDSVRLSSHWGKPKETKVIDLPSGSKVRIKELEIPDMIRLGVMDVVDSFTKTVLPKEPGKKGKKPIPEEKLSERIMRNPEQLSSMVEVIDRVCVESIVKPQVLPKPQDGTELTEGVFYVHLIPFEDKMEVFGKSFNGLDEFLPAGGEQDGTVGAVASSESV